ncbi:MAG: M1 family aminopeptidase [Bacteroidota bacterium]
MRSYRLLLAALCGLLCSSFASAQPEPALRSAGSPDALADSVVAAFAEGNQTAFDGWYPFDDGRSLLASGLKDGDERVVQLSEVVSQTEDEATLLIGAFLRFGNTGDETIYAGDLSGLYLAGLDETGRWRLTERIGWESLDRAHSHRLHVELLPGWGLDVVDTLAVEVRSPHGLLFALNHAAIVESVVLNGEPVDYLSGGGRLWIDAPAGDTAHVVLTHSVHVAQDAGTNINSGRFETDFGHVRNQYHWHAFGDYDDDATMQLTVRSPADVHVATDLPQQVRVQDEVRITRGESEGLAGPASLFYDAGWEPTVRSAGDYSLAVFATPDFEPSADSLAKVFVMSAEKLKERFSSPPGTYIAVVQQRARPGNGWPFMSNKAIAAYANGGFLASSFPHPRALFGHEVAHAWTSPSGPARNFLSEGWATYAESILLQDQYGPDTEALFWETKRNNYFASGHEGNDRLADDIGNNGVSYDKGAWVMRMLIDHMGKDAFDAGLRTFARSSPADYPAFVAAMNAAAGSDIRPFLDPWMDNSFVPDLRANLDGQTLVVSQVQEGAPYLLDVEVGLATPADTHRVQVLLDAAEARVELGDILPDADLASAAVLIDPDHRLLVRRLRGERVRLTVDAPSDATVELSGDFYVRGMVPAVYDGERWNAEIPLVAGTYFYNWRINGSWKTPTSLQVEPVEVLDMGDVYP